MVRVACLHSGMMMGAHGPCAEESMLVRVSAFSLVPKATARRVPGYG